MSQTLKTADYIADWIKGTPQWRPVSEEIYNEKFNAVPPIRQKVNGFLYGEIYTYDQAGEAVYVGYRVVGSAHFRRIMTWAEFDRV